MRVRFTAALVTVVIKFFFILVVAIFFVGCDSYFGLRNNQIIENFDNIIGETIEFEERIRTYKLVGTVSKVKKSTKSFNGTFQSEQQLNRVYREIQDYIRLISKEVESIEFRRDFDGSLHPVYFTLYDEGFCIAFSNCMETYIIFFPNNSFNDLKIEETKYNYMELSRQGWYILKIIE